MTSHMIHVQCTRQKLKCWSQLTWEDVDWEVRWKGRSTLVERAGANAVHTVAATTGAEAAEAANAAAAAAPAPAHPLLWLALPLGCRLQLLQVVLMVREPRAFSSTSLGPSPTPAPAIATTGRPGLPAAPPCLKATH